MNKDENQNGTGSDNAGSDETKKDDAKDEGNQDDNSDDKGFDYDSETKRLEDLKGKGSKSKYSPLEKAEFSAKKIMSEIVKLGGDPKKVFSQDGDDDDDGNKGGLDMGQLADVVRKVVQEEVGSVKSTFAKAEIDSRIGRLTQDASERKHIEYVFNNVIQQTGDLNEDVENAYIIANKHRTKDIIEALTGKKKAEDGKSGGTGDGQKRGTSEKKQPDGKESNFAKERGLVWSEEEGRYVSPARLEHTKNRKK